VFGHLTVQEPTRNRKQVSNEIERKELRVCENDTEKYLCSSGETISTFTDGDVEDEFLHFDFPHWIRQFLL